jgi:formate/nitrite transporter
MPERMLIIDDEDIVLESCRKVFTAEGFEVVTTDNPATGLKLISDSKFDVVLCDWKMPGFDGMDVVEEVDKRSPESAIVMISGFPSVGRATEAMKRGAMDYVSKPFTPEEISEAVKRAVRQKIAVEKKTIGRFEKIVKSLQFPVPSLEDRAPQTIAETIANTVGVKKATSPWLSVLVLGVLAGAYIAFAGVLMTVVTFDMGGFFGIGFTKFIGGAMFSVGLMLVVIAGAELFTGNNLMVTSTLTRDITFGTMLKRWLLVYVANFIGSVIVALILYYSGLWRTGNGGVGANAVKIAFNKSNLIFHEALISAIGCNWLVCLAVWMALASRQTVGKIFAIFFPIMAFVAIGFEHCVANMYFIPAGLFLHKWAGVPLPAGASPGILSWANLFYKNLLPVTMGNIIGGGLFVGMGYWGAYLRPKKS